MGEDLGVVPGAFPLPSQQGGRGKPGGRAGKKEMSWSGCSKRANREVGKDREKWRQKRKINERAGRIKGKHIRGTEGASSEPLASPSCSREMVTGSSGKATPAAPLSPPGRSCGKPCFSSGGKPAGNTFSAARSKSLCRMLVTACPRLMSWKSWSPRTHSFARW